MIISFIPGKPFGENPTCHHGKSPRECRPQGNMPQPKESYA